MITGLSLQSSLFGEFGKEVGGHGWGALHVSDSQVSQFSLSFVVNFFLPFQWFDFLSRRSLKIMSGKAFFVQF